MSRRASVSIIGTGEVLLVASTAGLRAVTLTNVLALDVRDDDHSTQGPEHNPGDARAAVTVRVTAPAARVFAIREVTNLLLPPLATVTRVCDSSSLVWIDLWPSHGERRKECSSVVSILALRRGWSKLCLRIGTGRVAQM